MGDAAWDAAREVLCVRLDTIGDVLMSTPALRALKRSAPGRRVTLLTSSAAEGAARLVPEVDDVIAYDPPWMKATPPRSDSGPEFAQAQELRQRGFDAAVVFTVFSQNPLPSAMLCHLADIPLRLAHCRENPYQLLTHWVRETEPEHGVRHEVRRQLDLVSAVGARTADERLSLRVPPEAARRVGALLARCGIGPGERLAVLHPGATAPSRRWPAARFGAVASRLAAEEGAAIAFSGTPEEAPLVAAAVAACEAPAADLTGRLGIEELAALVAHADVLVTNNTGPAHLAAAAGTPVVDLYALTNPQHAPWMVPSRVLNDAVPCACCYSSTCRSGHHRCLLGVSADRAAEAAAELLDAAAPSEDDTGGCARA
ncbi:MAG: glycosyltransferase family 9 protein [Coriobacteriia bacterium]|nr:glycosyltransferase family 9 protein [Coriobacteriia bacterium]